MTASVTSQSGAGTGRAVLFATILGASMVFIDSSALNVALPALQHDLQATGTELLWIPNAYTLLLASGILVGGSLGDRYGRKRVYMLGIALFAVASLMCGLASSAGFLIAARLVQGVGGALMVPGSLALITAIFEPNRRGAAIGLWSTFASLTTIAGPILGGFLASLGLWRGVFFINLPLALASLAALYLRVPENRNESLTGHLDYLGAALATLGLAGLTFGLTEVSDLGWNSPLILAALLIGVVALISFVAVELRTREPMLPFRLFLSRTFTGTNLMTLFLYGALYAYSLFFSLNLIQAQGYSAGQAGLATLPFALLLAALSRLAGGWADRFGARRLLTIGPILVGIGFIVLSLPGVTAGPGSYWVTYFPAQLLLGVGMGLTVAPLTTSVMSSVPATRAGIASAINNAASRTAGVLALATLGALALALFGQALVARSAALPLTSEARAALQAQSTQLGAAEPPANLPADLRAQVQQAIWQAFVDVFRVVLWIAAGLAWLSALLAALFVDQQPIYKEFTAPG